MTRKEELKRDLIRREINRLYSYIMANNDDPSEHINALTEHGCIPLHVKDGSGFVLKRYVSILREGIETIKRIDEEF